MCVQAIANAMDPGADEEGKQPNPRPFTKYLPRLVPPLVRALGAHDEYEVCTVAVGCTSDVARSSGPQFIAFSDSIVAELVKSIEDQYMDRIVKVGVCTCGVTLFTLSPVRSMVSASDIVPAATCHRGHRRHRTRHWKRLREVLRGSLQAPLFRLHPRHRSRKCI